LLEEWQTWHERTRQRAALRNIADDPHLLADLGITREEALEQAGQPFWHRNDIQTLQEERKCRI
jgi:uncharacterized protein YjiS (DUF1127 family)